MSLSLIHFSDIHIESKDDIIFSRLDKIKSACKSVLPNDGDILIVVSGDIANSGKCQQYELAKKFFDDIKDYFHSILNSNVHFAFSPGNHDCDFSVNSSVRDSLLRSIKSADKIDKEFYDTVTSVQKNFFDFANNYGDYNNNIINKLTFTVCGDNILVLIINSAWMSELKENPGNLVIPKSLLFDNEIDTSNFKYVFYTFHHPTNWLYPDKKKEFISHIRKKADFVLIGHEHERDIYEKQSDDFHVYFSHGKELQDRNSTSSSFSIYIFDSVFQNYDLIDFSWEKDKYIRSYEQTNQLHKNCLLHNSVYYPNSLILDECNDIGISINHFSKDDVKLNDLFVCPDVKQYNYGDGNFSGKTIRDDFVKIIRNNPINVIIGKTSEGKTSLAKTLFLAEETSNSCCVFLDGSDFTSSNLSVIVRTIENKFKQQYSSHFIEDFRQLGKKEKSIIIDNYDYIKNNNNRKIVILDYLFDQFGSITITMSSELEIASIINSKAIKSLEPFYYYELLPLGNRKRKQLISKWYNLENYDQDEDAINGLIEKAQNQINSFLGNDYEYVPAIPVFVLSTLQNIDAKKPLYENTKFSFLYETLILKSISKISKGEYDTGNFNIDATALSFLAYDMLSNKKTIFSIKQLETSVKLMNEKYIMDESANDLLNRMINAKIIYNDMSLGEMYRFKYPYIFYYFAGRYIAKNLGSVDVQKKLEYMSSRLYNETYGNIIIFVCHFANNKDVIDNVLLNAYTILDKYEKFQFSKSNPIFDDIKDSLDLLLPETIAKNDEVEKNQEKSLIKKDEFGITDGQVKEDQEDIDDEVLEAEREIAEISSAFKTMEVLGQILKNYPTEVEGKDKLDIIEEIHNLGMRAISILVNTLIEYKNDLIDYAYDKIIQEKKNISIEEIRLLLQKFINIFISNIAKNMIHQVSKTLDNEHLLEASRISLSKNQSISAKLVLLDLKMNCLKKVNFTDIQKLRTEFNDSNEFFALCILDSIVGSYLNYNKCNPALRSRLCALCNFSEQKSLIESHKNTDNKR